MQKYFSKPSFFALSLRLLTSCQLMSYIANKVFQIMCEPQQGSTFNVTCCWDELGITLSLHSIRCTSYEKSCSCEMLPMISKMIIITHRCIHLPLPHICNDIWLYILIVELLVLVMVHYNHDKVNILSIHDLAYTHLYYLGVIWKV